MFPDDRFTRSQRRPRRHVLAAVQRLLDRHLPGWRRDNWELRQAIGIRSTRSPTRMPPRSSRCRPRRARDGQVLDPNRFTIGIARRRPPTSATICSCATPSGSPRSPLFGGIQLIFSGKAHPRDWDGKAMIQHIVAGARARRRRRSRVPRELRHDLGRLAHVRRGRWLNTPRPPNEASGDQRHEGRAQRRPEPSRFGRLVDRRRARRRRRAGRSMPRREPTTNAQRTRYTRCSTPILPSFSATASDI